MYKLLIVDDEQIEREGMAHFIQWDKYDIQPVSYTHLSSVQFRAMLYCIWAGE